MPSSKKEKIKEQVRNKFTDMNLEKLQQTLVKVIIHKWHKLLYTVTPMHSK